MQSRAGDGEMTNLSASFRSGRFFWSHGKPETSTYLIEQSQLDGSDRSVLVVCTELAASLAMDFDAERLYFAYDKSIQYVDLRTRKVERVLLTEDGLISGVTVYKEAIYYGDVAENTIRYCDKTDCGSGEKSVVLRNNSRECQRDVSV